MLKQETLDCNILAGLIGVWSLFIHSVWLATYLLYLIVSSVRATVAFLESVTSAVNVLKVRNYCLKGRIFFVIILACFHVPVHSFCVIAETVSHLDCSILSGLIGV